MAFRNLHTPNKIFLHPVYDAFQKTPAIFGCTVHRLHIHMQILKTLQRPNIREASSVSHESRYVQVLDSDGKLKRTMSLKKAQSVASKSNMTLLKIDTEHDKYQLVPNTEISEDDDSKKSSEEKGKAKHILIGIKIGPEQLQDKIKFIRKRLLKGTHVKVAIKGYSYFDSVRNDLDEETRPIADGILNIMVKELQDIASLKVTNRGKSYVIEVKLQDGVKTPQKDVP